MFKKLLPWYLLGLVILSLAFIYGCGSDATSGGGGGGATTHGTYSYHGTQSPGDVWSWTISAETFFGSNETTGMWLTGTWETLVNSGFGKAYISTAEGLNHPSAGDLAYFLEFPNTMLLVRPDNAGDSRVMVCAASASNPPDQDSYLFVNISKLSWEASDPAFGTVEATKSGSVWNFDVTNYLITGEFSSRDAGTVDFVYSNGTFTDETGSVNTKIFMTPSSVFFGDSGTGNGGFAGAKLETFSTSEFFAALNHTYKGVRFIHYPASSYNTGETEPITCTKHTTLDALIATSYSDIDTGATYPGIMITFEAQQPTGFRKGYVEDFGDHHREIIQCAISSIGPSGNKKYMLYGIGLDNLNRSFNFLIIQTD